MLNENALLTRFGPDDTLDSSPPEVVIVEAHGFGHQAHHFDLDNEENIFSDLFDAMREQDREMALRYIHLEADAGAYELAFDLAEELKPRRVDVVSVPMPLGMLDSLQLDFAKAVKNIFDPELFPLIEEKLRKLHADGLELMRNCVSRVTPGGVVFFPHSMSPFDRTKKPGEDGVSLAEYIDSYVNPANRGASRPIDIVTASRETGLQVDRELVETARECLAKGGHRVDFNKPFDLAPETLQHEVVGRHPRTLIIDHPKHLLLHGASAEKVADRLDDPSVDDEKVKSLANIYFEIIERALRAA